MSDWLLENWYLVGFVTTLFFATVAFVVAGAYYWSEAGDSQGGYPYFYLALFPASFAWIISLPITALICIGRIVYLLRHRPVTKNMRPRGTRDDG